MAFHRKLPITRGYDQSQPPSQVSGKVSSPGPSPFFLSHASTASSSSCRFLKAARAQHLDSNIHGSTIEESDRMAVLRRKRDLGPFCTRYQANKTWNMCPNPKYVFSGRCSGSETNAANTMFQRSTSHAHFNGCLSFVSNRRNLWFAMFQPTAAFKQSKSVKPRLHKKQPVS